MTKPVLETFELGTHWPTPNPFLFCAHHLDFYPQSDGQLRPKGPLTGRTLGSDFSGRDGFNMYHGKTVPGFPQHPHRGFETITYVRQGFCDHADSLGAKARFGPGDMQWLTAGSGIVHSEMFPLLFSDRPNPLHLFQIWLNLPARSKLVDPYYSMYWAEDTPTVEASLSEPTAQVTSVVGSFNGANRNSPPPDSWAATPEADVHVWHIRLDPKASVELPAAASGSNRSLYVFTGTELDVGGHKIRAHTGASLSGSSVRISASDQATECLVLQGQPIEEPVVQHGPFVMNTTTEINQAIRDYQATGFGGWPWPSDDPTHGTEPKKFSLQ